MRFSAVRGALAGGVGGIAMLAVVAVPGATGHALPLDVARFWGGVTGRPRLALTAHGAVSAAVGVVLAGVAAVAVDAEPSAGEVAGLGLGFASLHTIVALGSLPSLLHRFPATLDPPIAVGRWCRGIGAGALATAVASHVAYGVTGAAAYRALTR